MGRRAKKTSKYKQRSKVKGTKAKKEKSINKQKENKNTLLGKKIKRNMEDSRTNDSSMQYKPSSSEQISKKKQASEDKNIIFFKSGKTIKYSKLKTIFGKYGKIKFLNITKNGKGLVEFAKNISFQSVIRDKSNIFDNYKLKISFKKNKGNKYKEEKTENEIIELKEEENDIVEENILEDNDITTEIDKDKSKNEENEEIIIEESHNEKNEEDHKNEKENDSDAISKIKSLEEKIKEIEGNLETFVEKYQTDKKKFMKMIGVLSETNYQNEKYIKYNLNVKYENLNNKFELLLNSYKVLFIRKLANLFLDELYKRYSDSFKDITFKSNKQKHTITICTKDLKNIDSSKINLIIDFLKHIKLRASSIIHIQDNEVHFQKEILFAFLDRDIQDYQAINDEVNIPLKEAMGIIFEKKETKKEVINKKKTNFYDNMKELITNEINEIEEEQKEKEKEKDTERISEEDNYEQNDEKKDEERIKKILSGDENLIKTNLSFQLNQLLQKIQLNTEIVEKDEKLKRMVNIDGKFFYDSWYKSFDEKFKMHHKFIQYVDKTKIENFANLGYYLSVLLGGFKINFYLKDPNQLDKRFAKNK